MTAREKRSLTHRLLVLSVAVVAGALLVPLTASAATITPTITADEDTVADPMTAAGCSLREAISAANTDGDYGGCTMTDEGPDVINLANGATYTRSLADAAGGVTEDDTNLRDDLDVIDLPGGDEEDLTITATGPLGATIQGSNLGSGGRVLHAVTIQTELTISRVELESGRAVDSGGGGIFNFGTLNLTDSTLSGNVSEDDGGGIENAGTLNATNSTIFSNHARSNGGGLHNFAGTATLSSVTVSANEANTMAAPPDGIAGGIHEFGGTINLRNTIVAGNSQAFLPFPGPVPDCAGTPTSLGYNLIGNTSGCGWASAAGDITNPATAGLGFLVDNGGPTRTVALLANSPARDAGNPAVPGSGGDACPATDQRGVGRPLGPFCDIGAFEATPVAAPATGTTTPTTGTTPRKKKKKCKKKKKRRGSAAARKKCKKKKRR